jgi:D-glycero-D-manno-heptose 1,7-bisphosphate phosphatase
MGTKRIERVRDEVSVQPKRRAVFLDRDGTIIVEKHYLHRVEDVELISGAPEAIRLLRERGFLIIVVTNQSGVARGRFQLDSVSAVHERLDEELARFGASVDAYYVCPHHPDGEVAPFSGECECRKPLPGMLLAAARDFPIDLPASYMIGDKAVDLEAGIGAGCRPLLVLTGYGVAEGEKAPSEIPRYADLLDAAKAICGC